MKNLKHNRILLWVGLSTILLMGMPVIPASANHLCIFETRGTTVELMNDCGINRTVFIPDGFTFDGNNHVFTVTDPANGHFLGAVLKNAGSVAHVKDLIINGGGLADVCDGPTPTDTRLRGILFEGASGSIKRTKITNIRQLTATGGGSGCQEGNAIEIRNAPFDGTHPATKTVEVKDNIISAYQKTGIVANGDVNVTIKNNSVSGLGPVDFIAQNGIQFGFGGMGEAKNNTVSGNQYLSPTTPANFTSAGILIFAGGDGISIKNNTISASDIGIDLAGGKLAEIKTNHVTGSTFDGIALDDQSGTQVIQNNTVKNNTVEKNDNGIGLYGADMNIVESNIIQNNLTSGVFVGFGATGNQVSRNNVTDQAGDGIIINATNNAIHRNIVRGNDGNGIIINGSGNTVERNIARENSPLDIENTGANTYSRNVCEQSSGTPVDCGSIPSSLRTIGPETLPTRLPPALQPVQ